MDGLALSSTTASCSFSVNRSLLNLVSFSARRIQTLDFRPQKARGLVYASKNNPNFDKWDQMELKFGQMLGEDPKLTLAKIMGRKLNPDVSYLEIEKSFYKNKGKSPYDDIEELPFDGSKPVNGLNLVRPVPKEGVTFDDEERSKSGLGLIRPVLKKGTKFKYQGTSVGEEVKKPKQPGEHLVENSKSTIPNVILRKPSNFYNDSGSSEKSARLRIQPNLSLSMGEEPNKQKFSDITLLKKPDPRSISNHDPTVITQPEMIIGEGSSSMGTSVPKETDHPPKGKSGDFIDTLSLQEPEIKDNIVLGTQLLRPDSVKYSKVVADSSKATASELVDLSMKSSIDIPVQEKPKRLNQSMREGSYTSTEEVICENPEHYTYAVESEDFLARSTFKEHEDDGWQKLEDLAKDEGKDEVELISSSSRGFAVSFGSLVGFLPYRNLAPKLKFLAFETWLRKKGLDPSMYKQNLGIVGNYEVATKNPLNHPSPEPELNTKIESKVMPNMKLDDLLQIYDQEKLKFLSSFVGQKVKVNILLADRKSRKLIVSMRPKEKEELVEKKRKLMAKLSVGDVVKCCIKKITYFGIFVEIEGVPALIHQTEVSWDATLDPASYFKIGQIVEAKVHQLDFSLDRIFLSLKEITPDPLIEALECVVGERSCLDERLEAAQEDTEWADVESLVRELGKIEGIQSVSKGRFFLSPGLAPTFQVYMASMFEDQYKLLARSGNRVQELIVQASLQKEEMKSAILTCTSRVE